MASTLHISMERPSWLYKIQAILFAEKSVLSQSVLRIAFGGFVMWQAYDKGVNVFSGPKVEGFSFSYPGFGWVSAFPDLAQALAILWFVSGLLLFLGFLHRFSSLFCFVMTAYGFLLRAEFYLNHEYMELCYLFLLTIGPSNQRLSVDSFIWKYKATAPNFNLLALKLQTEIILVYAGLVKINSDWLQLQPLSNWLIRARTEVFFGDIWQYEWSVAAGAYGIILLHLVGAPLLFWRRTRLLVFGAYVIFHIINSQIFPIDIFPWMTIACSTLFFDPDWPSAVFRRLSFDFGKPNAGKNLAVTQNPGTASAAFGGTGLILFLCVWLTMQVSIPLRHYLYPGWVEWNLEGTRFSWRMMLSHGVCPVWFLLISDPERREIYIADVPFILRSHSMLKSRLCDDPDLILQTAQHVRDYYVREAGMPPQSEIRVYIMKSLNFRTPSLLVDPTFNLAKQRRQIIGHYPWLLPGQDLGDLPAPFKSNRTNFRVPDLVLVASAMGFDLLADYECKYQRPPKRAEGNDLHCLRK